VDRAGVRRGVKERLAPTQENPMESTIPERRCGLCVRASLRNSRTLVLASASIFRSACRRPTRISLIDRAR
jgi:hypothetical protein